MGKRRILTTQTQLRALAFCQLIGFDWVTVATRKPDVDTLEANPGPECRYGEKRASPSTKIMQASKEMPQKIFSTSTTAKYSLCIKNYDLRGMPIGQNLLPCRCCGSVRSRRGRTPAGYGDSLRLRRTGTRSFMHYTEVKL